MNQLTQNLLADFLSDLLSDLRYAFRQFRRSPGFTAAALITLALGIGVNTAAFTLMYGILFKPLPVPHPEQLYRIGDSSVDCCEKVELLDKDGDFDIFSYDLYSYLAKSAPEFEQLAATPAGPERVSVRAKDMPAKSLPSQDVTGNYFETLGIKPFMGRLLAESDESKTAPPVAVISYKAWKREFGGDPSIVGSTVLIQKQPATIVGIAPKGFYGDRIADDAPALWMPMPPDDPHDRFSLYIIGRVRPGTAIAPLQEKLSLALRQWLASRPELANQKDKTLLPKQHVVLASARRGIRFMAEEYDTQLKMLMLLASIVLLIACSNIANLLLVRSISRRATLSVGIALGGSRVRMAQLVFTETLLLSMIGGMLGIGLAYLASEIILAVTFSISLDLPVQAVPAPAVLFFAGLISIGTGLITGLAPARLSWHVQPIEALRGFNHSTPNLSTAFQRTLFVLQAALSVVLLAGAFLTARSLYKLGHQDFVIQMDNMYALRVDLSNSSSKPDQRPELIRRIRTGFSSLSGVTGVGFSGYTFLAGWSWPDCVAPQGTPVPQDSDSCPAVANTISPDYLKLIGIPLLQGREFTDQDNLQSPDVAIVNESFVRRFYPNQDALGKRYKSYEGNFAGHVYEIVGVCKDFKTYGPQDPVAPLALHPVSQLTKGDPNYFGSIIVRFKAKPDDADGMLRRALAKVDPSLTIVHLRSMDTQFSQTLVQEKLIARLAVVFALLALTLAAVGLYGVTSYTVAQRTGEIGIRMALGSTRFGIIRLVLRGVLLHTGLGLLIGIPCALAAGYLLRDQLYELHWYDPVSLIGSILILSTCALAAGLIPAYRAASIQPMQALRVE